MTSLSLIFLSFFKNKFAHTVYIQPKYIGESYYFYKFNFFVLKNQFIDNVEHFWTKIFLVSTQHIVGGILCGEHHG